MAAQCVQVYLPCFVVIFFIRNMAGEIEYHRVGIDDLEIGIRVPEIIERVVVFLALVHKVFLAHGPAMLIETVIDYTRQ